MLIWIHKSGRAKLNSEIEFVPIKGMSREVCGYGCECN